MRATRICLCSCYKYLFILFVVIPAGLSFVALAAENDKAVFLVPATEGVPVLRVPAIDPDILIFRDKTQRSGFEKVLYFAEAFEVDATPDNYGEWESLAAGTVVWRLYVSAPGATDINIGFTDIFLPAGCSLYLTAPQEYYQIGPFTEDDNTDYRQLWTPVLPGDLILIEAEMPIESAGQFVLTVGQVNSGYRDLFNTGLISADKQQGWCNIDVICPEADGWRDDIRSVGRYTFGGTSLCTGNLVMNQREDFTAYFLTAAHCVNTSSVAATVVVYWNYESPTCGALSGGSLGQYQSGSTLRATHSGSDFTLLELNAMPESSFNVYYAGWDRSGNGANVSVCIHHPRGKEKAISFEDDPIESTAYLSETVDPNASHWRVVDWDIGTTEGGSSGSGLWNAATQRIVGQLHGGYAACGNDLSDWYGKFSVSWTGGGTSASRLRDWLDPDNTGVIGMDGGDPNAGADLEMPVSRLLVLAIVVFSAMSTGIAAMKRKDGLN